MWSMIMKTGQIKKWCLVGVIMGRVSLLQGPSCQRTGMNQLLLLYTNGFTLPALIPSHPSSPFMTLPLAQQQQPQVQ